MTELPGIAAGANVNADFLVALGGIKKQLQLLRQENHEAQRQAHYAALKNYLPLTQTVVLNSQGFGFVDFGTPAFGRVWTVREILASEQGLELTANIPANIGWYIGVNVPNTGVNAAGTAVTFTSQWRASATGVPFLNTYTSDILQARYGEHFFAIVTGPVGVANATMVFNAVVLDEPMKVSVPTSSQG